MKLSLVKLPALYGTLYWLFAAGLLVVASISAVTTGFSLAAVAKLLLAWQNHWWWLAMIGLALHVVSYAKSLTAGKLMAVNIIGSCVFVAYVLLPNFLPLIMLVHLGVIAALIRTRHSATQAAPQGV